MIFCGLKFGHDGSVALIDDDVLIFSVELEKIANNMRYAPLFDLAVVLEILGHYGYRREDVDHFVLDGWHPRKDVFQWGEREIHLPRARYIQTPLAHGALDVEPNPHPEFPFVSYPHYVGHAAAAYATSPFAQARESSFVLSWDGGMVPYAYYYDAQAGRFENLGSPFNLVGDLYAEMAAGCGPFAANPSQWESLGTPGKIMAYAAHGQVQESLIEVLREHTARLPALSDANVRDIYSLNLELLPGIKATPEFGRAHGDDVIASYHTFVQRVLVESLTALVEAHPGKTRNFAYAGGCALNIKWNQAIRSSGLFDAMWVPPFPNDAGSALGTACCAMMGIGGAPALHWTVYSGPKFILNAPEPGWRAAPCSVLELAALLHRTNEPVLFLEAEAELGPRALGHRSILAPATHPEMKGVLNRIKNREGYRPVAPICLEAQAPAVFDPGVPDPYMLYDHHVRTDWRDRIPAIQHIDGTARLQTVNEDQNPLVFELLVAYHAASGVPLLCNTSANFNGKGFFPDLQSATSWGQVNHVWSGGTLFSREARLDFETNPDRVA